MESCSRTIGETTSTELVLTDLYRQREKVAERSKQWYKVQAHIDQIVATNFLYYVNR